MYHNYTFIFSSFGSTIAIFWETENRFFFNLNNSDPPFYPSLVCGSRGDHITLSSSPPPQATPLVPNLSPRKYFFCFCHTWSPWLQCAVTRVVLINPYPDPTEKTIDRSPFFLRRGGHCYRGDLVGWTTFWIVLSGLQRLEFGRCSLFPSWSG